MNQAQIDALRIGSHVRNTKTGKLFEIIELPKPGIKGTLAGKVEGPGGSPIGRRARLLLDLPMWELAQ
jgi:hypothetical protein